MSIDINTVSHTSLQINEDILGYSPKAIWVLDGATSISGRKKQIANRFESDASWFVNQFSNQFLNIESDVDLSTQLKLITKKIQKKASLVWDNWDGQDVPSASFSAAFYNEKKIYLYNLGDCRILYQIDDDSIQAFGQSNVEALDQELLEQYKSLRFKFSDLSHKEIWQQLVPQIRINRLLMNQPNGYWILSPDGLGIDHLQQMELNYQRNVKILLSSDGLYRLVDTYNKMSTEEFFTQAFQKNGLNTLLLQLREIEENDSKATQYPRVKLQDDASAISIHINL